MKSGQRIRLLVTVPQFSPTTSPYRDMIALARNIPKDEFELTICALRKKGMEEVAPELKDLGVNYLVAQFRPLGQPKYHRHVAESLKDQSRIGQYGPYDIQHSLDFVSMPFEAFLARAQSRAYVFTHAMLGEDLQWRSLRMKARLSKRVFAVSHTIAKALQQNGIPDTKVQVVYLGIDLDEVDAKIKSITTRERGLILSVARISPEKRHEDSIVAMAKIVKQHPEAHLKILGGANDPSYLERLKTLVAELGLNEHVEFAGLRTDVLQLMRSAECMVHCRRDEPCGWVIKEAMAVGCPVVACNSGGPSDVLDHDKTGLLVEPEETDGFANSVLRILNSPDYAGRMGANARKAVEERFTSKGMVQRYRKVYRELVDDKS